MYNTSQNPLIQNTVLDSKFINPDYLFTNLSQFVNHVFNAQTLEIAYIVLSFLSIFFIAIIVYTTIRMFEIREKEHAHLHKEIEEYAHHQALKEKKLQEGGVFKNERWKKVLDYLFSTSENDWKLAILEADIILDDMLDSMGYRGATMSEKLQGVERSDFTTIDSAWEAHKVRNSIAHEGTEFLLNEREARRIIGLYESVFKEFNFI